MEIELKKSKNELLHRVNIIAKIRSVKTPSRKELLKKVTAMLGADSKLIVIDKIAQKFGEKISIAYIKMYDDIKYLKDIELNYKIKRTGDLETLDKADNSKVKTAGKQKAEDKPEAEVKDKEVKTK